MEENKIKWEDENKNNVKKNEGNNEGGIIC